MNTKRRRKFFPIFDFLTCISIEKSRSKTLSEFWKKRYKRKFQFFRSLDGDQVDFLTNFGGMIFWGLSLRKTLIEK